MRPEVEVVQAIDTHGACVWRVCVLYFGASADAEDAFQETIIRYATGSKVFESSEHCKAWLIRVATNVCKDMQKAAHRKTVSLDGKQGEGVLAATTATAASAQSEESLARVKEVLDALHSLSDPPRTPVYLALYEGYTAQEIAHMLGAPVGTVYSWIARGKKRLREVLA